MNKLIFMIAITVILTSVFGVESHLLAQAAERVEIAAITSDGIRFYTRRENGDLQLVGQLPSNFVIEDFGQGDWIVPSTTDFAVSNNGQQIAFTAQNGSEVKLFIYTVGEADLQSYAIPNLSFVEWSPDSSAVLLESTTNGIPSSIYEIASKRLIPIPNSEGFSGGFQWLPNGDKMLFIGIADSCSAPCLATDVYIVNRDGQGLEVLTHNGLATFSPAYVCGAKWNAYNQRVYYVVECGGEGNPVSDNIYSVDLQGQSQLEVDWSSVYPEHIVRVSGIHVAPDGSVYLVATVTELAGTETQWIVAHLVHGQKPQIVFTTHFDGYKPLYKSQLSPQGIYLALNGYLPVAGGGDIVVLETSNGQVATGEKTIEQACDIQWLNNEELLVTEVEGWCTPTRALGHYKTIQLVNVDNGTTSTIIEALDAPVWLIRNTQVAAR